MSIQPRISNAELQRALVQISMVIHYQRILAKTYHSTMIRTQKLWARKAWAKVMNRLKGLRKDQRILTNLLHRRLLLCSKTVVPVPQKYQALDYTVSDIIHALRLSNS